MFCCAPKASDLNSVFAGLQSATDPLRRQVYCSLRLEAQWAELYFYVSLLVVYVQEVSSELVSCIGTYTVIVCSVTYWYVHCEARQ